MKVYNFTLCFDCKSYNQEDFEKLSCKAYPGGIPDEILDGDVNHRKSYKGDHGIQYEKEGI